MFDDYKPYVSAADRRRRAARAAARLKAKGSACAPVLIEGSAIARSFWGKSWCQNMERYSDFYSRLERGRSYVRSGAVVDLSIAPGVVRARVMGSRLYTVEVKIAAVPKLRWSALCRRCGGAIDSLVELLQGRLSKSVMEHICERETGLFPYPEEIEFTCSCPDWASMCKHVAAVLYGIGARLDEQPQLLFVLRKVDANALIASAGSELALPATRNETGKRLDNTNLSALFGIDIAQDKAPVRKRAKAKRAKAERTVKKKRIARTE